MLFKRMQHIFKRWEFFIFLFFLLLLDVIFISSFFGINLKKKEKKTKEKFVFDFLYGFLLHGTAVDYCTNCNSFYMFLFSFCICNRFMLMFLNLCTTKEEKMYQRDDHFLLVLIINSNLITIKNYGWKKSVDFEALWNAKSFHQTK